MYSTLFAKCFIDTVAATGKQICADTFMWGNLGDRHVQESMEIDISAPPNPYPDFEACRSYEGYCRSLRKVPKPKSQQEESKSKEEELDKNLLSLQRRFILVQSSFFSWQIEWLNCCPFLSHTISQCLCWLCWQRRLPGDCSSGHFWLVWRLTIGNLCFRVGYAFWDMCTHEKSKKAQHPKGGLGMGSYKSDNLW